MMLRKLLFIAVGSALCAQAAMAQSEYDDRWMLTPYAGVNFNDQKRDADNALVLGVGIGRFINSRVFLDLDVMRTAADLQKRSGNWESMDVGFNARVFLGDVEREGWRPYALLGLRSIRSEVDVPGGNISGRNWGMHAGAGLQTVISDKVSFRGEVAYRYDADDESIIGQDDYSDWLTTVGLSYAFGERASTPAIEREVQDMGEPNTEPMLDAPAPAPAPMSDDSDGDGVKNASDKCPDTARGTMVDRTTGCEVAEVIDLRGVNFDFDRCTLRSDAVAILNNAVDVLKSHSLRVSVEGHTDAVGTDAYNEVLSECRAKVVYDYLLSNGVVQDNLTGHKGFGESMPIDTNDTAEGRANNRRTELNKQ